MATHEAPRVSATPPDKPEHSKLNDSLVDGGARAYDTLERGFNEVRNVLCVLCRPPCAATRPHGARRACQRAAGR